MTYFRLRSTFSTLFFTVAVCSLGCSQNNEEPVSRAEKGEVPTAKRLKMLVAAEELIDHLGDKNLLILDARSAADYAKGHIPDAVHVSVGDWKDQGLKNAGKGLEDKQTWTTMARKLGINNNSQVVVHAGANPLSATRVWWTLRYLGVEDASLLDGGWPAWVATKGKTSTDAAKSHEGNFDVDFQNGRYAPIDWVIANHKKDGVAMMDTRSAREYAVHVPGATRLEWIELLDNGKLKSVEELQKIFIEKGFDQDNDTVVYCRTGGRASLNAFALELAGFKKVRSYYSGWSLYGTVEDAPKENVKSEGKIK